MKKEQEKERNWSGGDQKKGFGILQTVLRLDGNSYERKLSKEESETVKFAKGKRRFRCRVEPRHVNVLTTSKVIRCRARQ